MHRIAASLLPLLLSFTVACDKPEAPPAPPAPTTTGDKATGDKAVEDEKPGDDATAEAAGAPVPGHPEPSMAAEVMRGHFEQANEARQALIRADLDRAKKAMKWLAEHELGVVLPEELAPMQTQMQAAAAAFGEAKNLREAGIAMAKTLSRCGDCHRAAGKGPVIASEPVPDEQTLQAHMRRHHWAAREIWAGLVTASEATVKAGIEALDEAPLEAEVLTTLEAQRPKVVKLDAHVHALGLQMRDAASPDARLEAYGHMLATCAVCHRMMGRGPAPVPDFE